MERHLGGAFHANKPSLDLREFFRGAAIQAGFLRIWTSVFKNFEALT